MTKCPRCNTNLKATEQILGGYSSPYLECPVCEEPLVDAMDSKVRTFTMYVEDIDSWVICRKCGPPDFTSRPETNEDI